MVLPTNWLTSFQKRGGRGKEKRGLFGWFILSCLLCSCSLPVQNLAIETTGLPAFSVTEEATAVISVSPEASSTASLPDIPTPTLTPPPNSPSPTPVVTADNRYTLQVQFDYAGHHLEVAEQVSYLHAAQEPISELVFLIEANRFPNSFRLSQMTWRDGNSITSYELELNRLTIPLEHPMGYGERVELRIDYTLDLPEIPLPADGNRPQPYGYTSRQTNLVDWYPVLPPYRQGEGWLAHKPGYFGEHQVYQSADYQVEINLIDSPTSDRPLIIAASTLPEIDKNPYRYAIQNARNFAWSASDAFVVSTAHVGDITINSYTFSFDSDAGKVALQNAKDAVRLYSKLFGPYPQHSLSIIEADFLDGMEYQGLFFLSRGFYNLYDGTPDGYLTIIAVHETAHQWWYGLVGNDQALEPWLDEALCTYSEKLFYEYTYPQLLNWWWQFRVEYYQPKGFINGSIYDYNGFLIYRNSVYLRGAQFLEALRQAVGDEAFFAFLQGYAAQKANDLATADDFFSILKAHTKADIKPLLEEYFK